MAGEGPVLTRLQAALRSYDDEALAALANKGLVRRARKDLGKAAPRVTGAAGGRLALAVEDCAVELSEAVKDASCTCPAEGFCRHILAALIFLRDSAAAAPPAAVVSCGPEILAVDDEALEKWAGRAMTGRALESVARGLVAEFEDAAPFVIRFPGLNVTCRWMPGGRVEGMVCSCHAREACEHRVAAVVAYQVAQGKRTIDAAQAGLGEPAGAPRTREEVRASLGRVLAEMIGLGFARLSLSVEQRMRTLAVSAHGVDLPRLERLVNSLADEVKLTLARDAQADSGRLLATAAQAEALRCALAYPRPGQIGEHRTAYDRVGDIELLGLGARRWRTRSGYFGLTIYFWDRSARDWATWTEARPETAAGFDPQARFTQSGPWAGCASPSSLVRNAVRLAGAWKNKQGRLSGRPGTRVVSMKEADPLQGPPAVARWGELAERAYRLFVRGLAQRRETEEIVLLAPAKWGPAQFDAIRQVLLRPVFDVDGWPLLLVLPFTTENRKGVEALEAADAAGLRGVLGLLRLHEGRLAVEPAALVGTDRVVNLTLDAASAGTPSDAAPVEDEEADAYEEAASGRTASPLGALLTALEAQMEAIAEGGSAAYRDLDTLKRLGARADALGLAAAAKAVRRLTSALDALCAGDAADPGTVAPALLHAHFVTGLAADLEATAAAVAGLG